MTDYIRREDAIKICETEIQDITYITDVFGKRCDCVVGARRINTYEIAEQIKKISSADVVERKRGKWINSKCSECGGLMPITKVLLRSKVMWETDYPMSRFCPNCGADMRSETNEI